MDRFVLPTTGYLIPWFGGIHLVRQPVFSVLYLCLSVTTVITTMTTVLFACYSTGMLMGKIYIEADDLTSFSGGLK